LDAQQNGEGSVDVVCALDQPLPDHPSLENPFDFVLCTEVLEHVADWGVAFDNLAALTRSGGKVLVTCPHFYVLHEEPYDFWRPTMHAVHHYASLKGFRTVRSERAGNAWDVLGTFLANTYPFATSDELGKRLAAKFVRLARRVLLRLLLAERLQSRVRLDSALYVSNVALLERL